LAAIPLWGETESGRGARLLFRLGLRGLGYRLCSRRSAKQNPQVNYQPLDTDASAVHSRPTDRGKLSCRGSSPLLCAPVLRGPRVSSAAWHRLDCLLRGTTWPRLCVPTQLPAPPRCWCAYSGHLLLGAPTRRVKRFGSQRPQALQRGESFLIKLTRFAC
jgi:hypothetical protein